MRSRQKGWPSGALTGTPASPALEKRYYEGFLDLAHTLRRLRRGGHDVERELLRLGSVYVLWRGRYLQVTAAEAIRLCPGRWDISPPHLRDTVRAKVAADRSRCFEAGERSGESAVVCDSRPDRSPPYLPEREAHQ